MLPDVGVPPTIAAIFSNYRDIFCRQEGFDHVSRYITGLLLSPNKTLEGIHSQQVWPEGKEVQRRAMHAAVFEAGWKSEELMPRHREVVSRDHRGKGREVIGIDWTLTHHDRGPKIFGVKRAYDYVDKRMSSYQTVVTATIANREMIDGLEVVVQIPDYQKEELVYLKRTCRQHYQSRAEVLERLEELLYYKKNRLAYRKRTEIAVDIIRQLELEGHFPEADYAFDNGVLTLELTQSFRFYQVCSRNGEIKSFWAFTKTVRLKKYGKKRLVIVHEQEDLGDEPRFLITDALHWECRKVIQTWSKRKANRSFS